MSFLGESKAIQWGLMGDVGIVIKKFGGNTFFARGSVPQRVPSFLKSLEVLMQTPSAVVAVIVQKKPGEEEGGGDGGGLVEKILRILGKLLGTFLENFM